MKKRDTWGRGITLITVKDVKVITVQADTLPFLLRFQISSLTVLARLAPKYQAARHVMSQAVKFDFHESAADHT